MLALAAEADRTSQTATAERLEVSASAVNSVIRNRYPANPRRIEQKVAGLLMNSTIACPELGEMPVDLCQEHQDRARTWSDTSSFRARMRRACRACPQNSVSREEA